MFPTGEAARTTAPTQPVSTPAPAQHVVGRQQTVEAIADQHRGDIPQQQYIQDLQAANPQVINWTALYPDTVLALPVNTPPVLTFGPMDSPASGGQTPQQRTDAAMQAYKQSPGPQTKGELRNAVQAEVAAQHQAAAGHGNTSNYDAKAIQKYGSQIQARFQDDAGAKNTIKDIVDDVAIDQEVSNAVTAASAGKTPQDTVRLLKEQWGKLSPQAQQRLQTSPELATLLRGDGSANSVEGWVNAPLTGADPKGDPKVFASAANASGQRLTDLLKGLPPELAYSVTQQNIDTVMAMCQVTPMYAGGPNSNGSQVFSNLTAIVGALGETPNGKILRDDIATMLASAPATTQRGQGVPLRDNIEHAIAEGGSPALALALAAKLQTNGSAPLAGAVLEGVTNAATRLQSSVKADVQEYQGMLQGLNRAMRYAEGLPPEAMQKAINGYLEKQDPQWKSKFEALESRLAERGQQLTMLIAGLDGLSPEVKATYAGDLTAKLKELAGSEELVQAMNFAAKRDPAFLTGPEANKVLDLAAEVRTGKEGTEAFRRLINQAVQQNAINVFTGLDPKDPASVAKAKASLQQLSTRFSGALGADGSKFRDAIQSLQGLVDVPGDNPALFKTRLQELDSKLNSIEGFQADRPSGIAIRSIGVAAGGILFAASAKTAIDDPTWQNQINAFGSAVSLSKDVLDLMTRAPDLSATSGAWSNGQTLLRTGIKVENFSKVLGVLSAAGDVANAVSALASDNPDYAKAGLYGLGAAGTIVMSLSGGPVGAVIGGLMVAGSVLGLDSLADSRDKEQKIKTSVQFLRDAGFTEQAARILSDLGEDQYYQSVPTVPLLMQAGEHGILDPSGKKLTPEESIVFANNMDPDELQVFINRMRVGQPPR